jgi:hypothetical protein
MTIDLTDAQLDALLKRLHLANARRAWRELVQRAEREEWSYRDFLACSSPKKSPSVRRRGSHAWCAARGFRF